MFAPFWLNIVVKSLKSIWNFSYLVFLVVEKASSGNIKGYRHYSITFEGLVGVNNTIL